MKKLTIMLGLFLFLIACQDKSNHEDPQEHAEPVSESVTADETQKNGLTSEGDEDIPPVYIDETNYTGDELEIVKLMNTRLRYLWEEDEKGYMSLIDPQSPVSGMSRTKVRKVISMSDITIQEQKKLYQGVVEVTELKENDVESSSIMVFWKKKVDGDSAQWIIADID
ncbi:hypothetical protein AB3N00_10185 [Paenibacillus xylanilyticus]